MTKRVLPKALRKALACPACLASLRDDAGGENLRCEECGARYPIHDGVPILLRATTRGEFERLQQSWRDGGIAPPTTRLARFASPPVHRPRYEHRRSAELLCGLDAGAVVVDIGCGAVSLDSRVYRLDMGPFPLVHAVGDAHRLPFADESVDGVYIHRVLEHVTDPFQAAGELFRVLKPGGFVSAIVPFMEPYHRNPIDKLRFGRDAVEALFEGFDRGVVEIWAGPTAAMLWMFKEYVAIVFPGSSSGLFYAAIREAVGWVTYPLILLDGWAKRRRFAHKIACEFRFVGYKPDLPGASLPPTTSP